MKYPWKNSRAAANLLPSVVRGGADQMTILGLAAAAETDTERNNKGHRRRRKPRPRFRLPHSPPASRSAVHRQMNYEARGEIKLGSEGSGTDRQGERERGVQGLGLAPQLKPFASVGCSFQNNMMFMISQLISFSLSRGLDTKVLENCNLFL